jgi:hypothetical protein
MNKRKQKLMREVIATKKKSTKPTQDIKKENSLMILHPDFRRYLK